MSGLVISVLLAGQIAGQPVQEVRFQGNRTLPRRVLASVVSTRPGKVVTETALEQDVAALERFYEEQGFFDARVEKGFGMVQGRLIVTFYLNEGPRTRIGQIALNGNFSFPSSRLLRLLPVRQGNSLVAAEVQRAVEVLRDFYANSGYPFVKVTSDVSRADTIAQLRLEIEEGPRCYIREVRIRGNQTVWTRTILRALEIQKGERYSQRRLYDAQRRLYATRLFQRVLFYVSRADSVSDSVIVRFDVFEQPSRSLAFGVGFEMPPVRGLVSAEWEHNNLFNRGQKIETGVEFSPDWVRNYRIGFEATYRVPYLLFTRVDFQTHPFLYWEKVDSLRQREYGVETGMSRTVLPQLHLGLFNRVRFVADTAHGITNSLALSSIYDSRDDVFEPRHGCFVQPGVEVAGGPLLGDNDFFRVTADARFYQSLGWGVVLAGRGSFGRVFPYGRNEHLPYYEEFFIGGRNSLRGYPDKSIGPDSGLGGLYGPTLVNGNLEVRGPILGRWVGLVLFADAGLVSAGGLEMGEIGYGAGFGIRVRTPIGPVRLDWGKRLKQPPAHDRGRLYLGLLHAF
ncbi:MAG: BamA/TamA family outer membrane protein [candidate division WOR-3 bacterium]